MSKHKTPAPAKATSSSVEALTLREYAVRHRVGLSNVRARAAEAEQSGGLLEGGFRVMRLGRTIRLVREESAVAAVPVATGSGAMSAVSAILASLAIALQTAAAQAQAQARGVT